jgi:hypothetical protein
MSHACPAGCGKDVPSEMYACKRDWYRLPKPYRNAVWRGYRNQPLGQAHRVAMHAAHQWYLDNPLPAELPR